MRMNDVDGSMLEVTSTACSGGDDDDDVVRVSAVCRDAHAKWKGIIRSQRGSAGKLRLKAYMGYSALSPRKGY